ncbi:MAG: glycosyltransferase family 2 protein [Patescibacteria group bacterium]
MEKISVVINTLNEEKNLPKAVHSIRNLADEIIVVDMYSTDETAKIAKKLGAKIFEHERTGYVEPARNFAISKALGPWILVLDADEEVTPKLASRLKKIAQNPKADYYRLPRKNIIFGKWIKHSRWWPDFNIRFFKKGFVAWNEVIHTVPMTQGTGADLPAKESLAILHYNYSSVTQYLERMNRYTDIQARILVKERHKFIWKDLITRPTGEFLSRYFAGEGYKDGLHGLALATLQAFSEFILYLKVWQSDNFLEQTISLNEIERGLKKAIFEIVWWLRESAIKTKPFLKSFPERILHSLAKKNV